jgi:trehalose/maltose hydrolase-like predicted phosphorylase
MLATAYCTNLPGDEGGQDPCGCAVSKLQYAYANEKELKASHDAAWKDLWNHRVLFTPAEASSSSSSGVPPPPSPSASSSGSHTEPPVTTEVPPTPKPTSIDVPNATVLQNVVDASFYALLSSMREDVPYSSSPGGLSTDGYNGHTFWDMETWMMPNLLLFYPEIAKGSAMAYRLARLPGAADNAKVEAGGSMGYAFPWESAFSGFPVCPWPQGATSELHITADVVGGWRMYYHLSGDLSFLQTAFDGINGTAAFWLSRATKSNEDGSWHINGVIPPDEYHFGNDSVYTNFAVMSVVNFTLEAASILNLSLPTGYQAALEDLAANLTILYNASGDYHPEFAGYKGDTVKQADVVMLNYPWGMPMAPSTVASDLAYYAPRTDPNGPAMTWSMFSIGYLSIGQPELAMSYFVRGFELNSFPPYYAWYEVPLGFGCPNFITGAGGFLQSIWAGLGGIRVTKEGLVVMANAYLPDTIGEMEFQRIHFQGSEVNIKLISSSSSGGAASPLQIRVRLAVAGPAALTFNGVALQEGFEMVTMLKHDMLLAKA